MSVLLLPLFLAVLIDVGARIHRERRDELGCIPTQVRMYDMTGNDFDLVEDDVFHHVICSVVM